MLKPKLDKKMCLKGIDSDSEEFPACYFGKTEQSIMKIENLIYSCVFFSSSLFIQTFSLWNINKKKGYMLQCFYARKRKMCKFRNVKLKYGKKNVSKGEKSRQREKTRKQKLK